MNTIFSQTIGVLGNDLNISKVDDLIHKLTDHKDSILLRLLKMSLYFKRGNKGRARTILRGIWKESPNYFIIQSENFYINFSKDENQKSFESLLDYIKSELPKREFKYLKIYLSQNIPSKLKNYISYALSLEELRELVKTYQYGYSYPGIWIENIKNRSTQKELYEFLDKAAAYLYQTNQLREEMWVFSHFVPNERVILNSIKEYVREVSSKEVGKEYLVLAQLMNNKDLFSVLKNEGIIEKPLFKLKRQIFADLITRDLYQRHSLLNLLEIGDYRPDLLKLKYE